MIIEKGQLLSYAFAPYGEDDKDGRLVATEDLILVPKRVFDSQMRQLKEREER